MPYDSLSPDALKQIGKLEKKLSAFMEQHNHEITAILVGIAYRPLS